MCLCVIFEYVLDRVYVINNNANTHWLMCNEEQITVDRAHNLTEFLLYWNSELLLLFVVPITIDRPMNERKNRKIIRKKQIKSSEQYCWNKHTANWKLKIEKKLLIIPCVSDTSDTSFIRIEIAIKGRKTLLFQKKLLASWTKMYPKKYSSIK